MVETRSLRLAAVMSSASQFYTVPLAADTPVSRLAQAADLFGASSEASTLEVAEPLSLRGTLDEGRFLSGDRLLLNLYTPKAAVLADTSQPTTRVTLQSGSFITTFSGKSEIIIGRSHVGQETVPDADLGLFVPSGLLDFISDASVLLYQDADTQQWFARRTGQTRVLIQEYELQRQPFPIAESVVLRLYPAAGSLMSSARLLVELHIQIELPSTTVSPIRLPWGDLPTRVLVGVEQEIGLIEVDGVLPLETVATHLLDHKGFNTLQRVRAYRLHTLPPATTVAAALAQPDSLLYLPRESSLIRSTLRVRSLEQGHVSQLYGSVHDETFTLGCRAQATVADTSLDVDVYDHIRTPMPPSVLRHLGYPWAHLYYERDANAWWIGASAHQLPLFLDGRRLGSSPVRVATDRVLSIGIEGTQVVLRYAIEPDTVSV